MCNFIARDQKFARILTLIQWAGTLNWHDLKMTFWQGNGSKSNPSDNKITLLTHFVQSKAKYLVETINRINTFVNRKVFFLKISLSLLRWANSLKLRIAFCFYITDCIANFYNKTRYQNVTVENLQDPFL